MVKIISFQWATPISTLDDTNFCLKPAPNTETDTDSLMAILRGSRGDAPSLAANVLPLIKRTPPPPLHSLLAERVQGLWVGSYREICYSTLPESLRDLFPRTTISTFTLWVTKLPNGPSMATGTVESLLEFWQAKFWFVCCHTHHKAACIRHQYLVHIASLHW